MYTIENQYLKVCEDSMGPELQSIYDKEMDKEILWYGDEKFWARRSPLLFPNVGRHYKNRCYYNGKCFDTDLHGFARSSEFVCIKQEENFLSFCLKDTEETRAYFPYTFVLTVSYRLQSRSLEVLWEVENNNAEKMYFTIGGHPGFNVPILEGTEQTDYKLLFNKQDSLEYHLVHENSGNTDMEKSYELPLEPFGTYSGCAITEHMFDHDSLIFDGSQVTCAGIAYPDSTPYITMDCEGFTNFGIWSLPGAPYICLEPWQGRCDDYGFEGDISEKPDVVSLEAGKSFHQSYTVTVHKKQ